MNNLKSYTEYAVTSETTDFVIGFDFNYGTDAVNVTVDGVPAIDAGYTVVYLNSTTMRLSPAVPTGVVRLQRETDIDVPDNSFTAGAKFIASNMDENFTQVRHAQQEVRDGFNKLSTDTYEIIDTLQVVGEAAQDAADAAEQAAQTANDAAAQVNDKVSYQDLDNAIAATPHNNLKDRDVWGAHPASAILDTSGLDQQMVNDNRTTSIKDYLSSGNGVQHKVQDLYTVGSAVYNPRFANLADVQSFYGSFVDSADYLLDQAALEKASVDAAAKGGNVVRIQAGVYFYKRLTIRTGVIFWGDSPQSVSLVCVDPNTLDPNVTTHGSSIKKPDDGQRVYRAGFVNMFLSTGAAGTGSNQMTYQKVLGINLCGCERTIMQNVSFAGFGYGAMALARAENGAEGLGFLNTSHDGNYNVFDNLSFASCGRYNPDSAVIWLKYKANSNKFYSIFAKGCTDAFMLVIDRSNDNFVAGGTLESSKGVAHLGLTTATSGNTIIGIRIEGASGDGYIFDTYAENNFVLGGYHTGVTSQHFKLVNPNNRILANTTNYLRNVAFPPVTNYSTLHNLAALQVSSINGSVSNPLYIKSEEYNKPLNYPKKVFYNDVINLVAGNILGEMAWANRDTSTGAAGESAAIQAIAEGSAGETAVVIKTGTGTTAVERVRVKANGGVALTGGIGLFGSNPPTAKPTITGKKVPTTVAEQNAVIDSIMAALVLLGVVTDGRTT